MFPNTFIWIFSIIFSIILFNLSVKSLLPLKSDGFISFIKEILKLLALFLSIKTGTIGKSYLKKVEQAEL